MRSSMRRRLQIWYGVVFLCSVAGFAAFLYLRAREARFRELDAELLAAAQYLDASLRTLPRGELGGDGPGPPPESDRTPPPGIRPPPRRPPRPQAVDIRLPLTWSPRLGSGPRDEAYFCVRRLDGSVIAVSTIPPNVTLSAAEPLGLGAMPLLVSRAEYREVVMQGPQRTHILVGRAMTADRLALRAFAWQLFGVGSIVVAIGLTGGWFVASLISRPLQAISMTASRISAAHLSERIDDAKVDDELLPLVEVLNQMFGRLECAFAEQARFTADASHELRTPLTVLRTQAELTLSRARSPEEYRQALDNCLQAARRMSQLVESLLTLARSDAGRLELDFRQIDLSAVLADGIELVEPLANSRNIAIVRDLAACEARVDAQRMTQVVTNLLSNALQASSAGSEVRVALTVESGHAVLKVEDHGCGIPVDCQPHLFERFYRVDQARTRSSGGNGLGLAITKSIVDSHGGSITFESIEGQGTTFEVRLPLR